MGLSSDDNFISFDFNHIGTDGLLSFLFSEDGTLSRGKKTPPHPEVK